MSDAKHGIRPQAWTLAGAEVFKNTLSISLYHKLPNVQSIVNINPNELLTKPVPAIWIYK